MNSLLSDFHFITETFKIADIIKALFLLVVGFGCAFVIRRLLEKAIEKHTTPHYTMLVGRICFYLVLFAFLLSVLHTLSFDISALLGAGGIVMVALGFAAKESMSNIISGLSLVFEKPFVIGDFIEFNQTVGEVISIGFLSVQLRTRDNIMVRYPNILLLSSEVRNTTRFPIRRFDIPIRISYTQNVEQLKKVLFAVADKNPLSLESPPPDLFFDHFGEFAIHYKFTVWAQQDTFLELKQTIPVEIQQAFLEHGLVMPVPQHQFELIGTTPPSLL